MSPSAIAIREAAADQRAGDVAAARAATNVAGLRSAARPTTSRDAALDYLRAFIIVLVVAHHAVLAYALDAPAARAPLHSWLGGIPIVDSQRAAGFTLIAAFNDIFFMPLMFFLSGLFVRPSLTRKGGRSFLRDRALRLGVPFALAALLAPLAFYPAYRAVAADPGIPAFWREWLSLGTWPSGPAWFVWMLLAFNLLAAGVNRIAPALLDLLGRWASGASRRPVTFFAGFMVVSAAAYLPMEMAFGVFSWAAIGPFAMRSSRLLLYAVYFFAGVGVGVADLGQGLLARDGGLPRRWLVWVPAALVLFAFDVTLIVAMLPNGAASGVPPLVRELILDLAFVLCCGTISFAMLGLFRRLANARNRVFDSLSRNAYGIYLVHYGFVLWLQYALLPAALPAAAKAAVVLAVALAASWTTTAALRRIPAVARVI